MRTKTQTIASALWIFLALTATAALPVTDVGLIATNRGNSERDYLEQLLQEANQQTQILRLVEQIRRLDDYLERFGDPATIDKLDGLELLEELLTRAETNKRSEVILAELDGKEVFQPDPVYRPTSETIVLDGVEAEARHSERYKPEAAAQRSFSHYREVRSSVLERRNQVKAKIAQVLVRLRGARTSSEVQKLSVLMTGLQTELEAIDREMGFAASEAATRMFENEVQRQVEKKAAVENGRARLREGTRKDARTYRITWEPILFNSQK